MVARSRVLEHPDRLMEGTRRQRGGKGDVRTRVNAVSLIEFPEETGGVFIFLNCSSILSVTRVKNLSSSRPIRSICILRSQFDGSRGRCPSFLE